MFILEYSVAHACVLLMLNPACKAETVDCQSLGFYSKVKLKALQTPQRKLRPRIRFGAGSCCKAFEAVTATSEQSMLSLASPAQSPHLVVLTEKLNTRSESAKQVSHMQIKRWQPDLRKRRQLELRTGFFQVLERKENG